MLRISLMAVILVLTAVAQTTNNPLPQMRMTPAEIQASSAESDQTGGAGIAGGGRKVLFGDPTKASYYSILLFVPPHTTIQAHSHRDNRMATVVSGEWHFGYGDKFNDAALKTLPPGSVYSEPGGINHFAQTGAYAVVVQISGYGPTDTNYADPTQDPRTKEQH
jgi:quercetin dioxygenase-like cupin family protein